MNLDIKGLRVLVTAGANGIGLAIARAFAGEGAKVHVCDVDTEALAALKTSDPMLTQTVCDVSDRAAVKALFAEATTVLSGLDVLVNNAGVAGPTAKVEEMNPEDWDRCLEICLTGQFNCARLAVPLLRESKNASIVNISSAAGRLGFAMRTPYAAAKWGVIGFTKSLSNRTRAGQHPRQRDPAGPRRRRQAAPRAGSQGAAARRLVRRDGADGVLLHVDQGLCDAAAARGPDRLHVQPTRQDHLRPGHLICGDTQMLG